MKFQKPSTAGHVAAIILAGGQAWWILKVDTIAPKVIPPLFTEAWQKILSCAFVASAALAVSTVRQTGTVKSEIFSTAIRSMQIGVILTFFAFEASNITLIRSGSSGWTKLPHMLLLWPFISVFVFGVTAGELPDPPRSPSPLSNSGLHPL